MYFFILLWGTQVKQVVTQHSWIIYWYATDALHWSLKDRCMYYLLSLRETCISTNRLQWKAKKLEFKIEILQSKLRYKNYILNCQKFESLRNGPLLITIQSLNSLTFVDCVGKVPQVINYRMTSDLYQVLFFLRKEKEYALLWHIAACRHWHSLTISPHFFCISCYKNSSRGRLSNKRTLK